VLLFNSIHVDQDGAKTALIGQGQGQGQGQGIVVMQEVY
jgi:hypothetical protein